MIYYRFVMSHGLAGTDAKLLITLGHEVMLKCGTMLLWQHTTADLCNLATGSKSLQLGSRYLGYGLCDIVVVYMRGDLMPSHSTALHHRM